MLCRVGLATIKRPRISTKKRTRNQVDFIHNCVELKRKTLLLKESIHKNTEKIMTSNNFIAIVFASSYYKAIKKNQHFLFIPNIGNATVKKMINGLFLRKKSIVRRRHLSKLCIKTKNSLMRDWRILITFPDSESSSQ